MVEKLRTLGIVVIFLVLGSIVWNILSAPPQGDTDTAKSETLDLTHEAQPIPNFEFDEVDSADTDTSQARISQKETSRPEVDAVPIAESNGTESKLALDIVSISGRIVSDLDQMPVDKFSLLLVQGQHTPEMDDNYRFFYPPTGEFTIRGISMDQSVSLRIRAPGYADSIVNAEDLRDRASRSNVTVILTPDYVLTGQVVDPRGKPVEGVRILEDELNMRETNLDYITVGKTDALGAFAIGGLTNEPYTLTTYHKEYAPEKLDIIPGQHRGTIQFTVENYGTIEGYVTFDGVPLPDILVDCSVFVDGSGPRQRGNFNKGNTTDSDGYFQIESVPKGTGVISTRLTTEHGNRRMQFNIDVGSGMTTQVDFPFRPATASIDGHIIADDTRALSRQVTLKVLSGGVDNNQYFQTANDGYYRFTEIPPGTVSLSTRLVAKSGYKFVTTELSEDDHVRIDLDLESGVTVRCRISNPPPNTNPQAYLIPENIQLPSYPNTSTLQFLQTRSTLRNRIFNGKLTFNNVDNGRYTIAIFAYEFNDENRIDESTIKVVAATVTVEGGDDVDMALSF